MHHKRASSNRGFSIPEVLTVSGIAGLVAVLIVVLTGPMLSASNAELASLHQIQMMDTTLYRLQREIRQSDPNGIFTCSLSSGQMSCALASNLSAPADISYLAILTARSAGTGQTTWDGSGRPAWTGFNVYWLAADGHGTNTLLYNFGPANVPAGPNPVLLNSVVAAAVAQAVAAPGATMVAEHVQRVQTMVDVTHDHVTLHLAGLATYGSATSELSTQGDVYARN